MQWSQIKTLFILCFLVLNLYLLYQIYEQQQKHDFVNESTESTFEEQLEQDQIKIPDSVLNTKERRESFINVEQKIFDVDELTKFEPLPNQRISIVDQTLIVSVIDETIRIPEKANAENIMNIINNLAPYMNEYEFWSWNKDLNVIILFQQKDGQTIYYNKNGLLLLFLNDNNEVVFYSQSMLSEEEATQEKQKLISPLRAIETIYNSGQLFFKDEITEVEVGFHTRIPSSTGVQVFVPTWKVVVNDEKNYFVNAIEGYVFASNDDEFLSETLTEDYKRIQSSLKGKEKYKKRVMNYYKEKLDLLN